MTKGVKLRCINPPYKGILAGKYYEVAEILEYPHHVMVRKPNGKWPKPGEWYFGMHPEEYFEAPPDGIPAFSCGYNYMEEEFFGVIIPDSLYPTPKRRESNSSKSIMRMSSIVESAGVPTLWWRTLDGIVPNRVFPETAGRKLLFIGMNHHHYHQKTSYPIAKRAIQIILRKLRIPSHLMPAIEDQQIEFWQRSWRKPGPLTWKSPTK